MPVFMGKHACFYFKMQRLQRRISIYSELLLLVCLSTFVSEIRPSDERYCTYVRTDPNNGYVKSADSIFTSFINYSVVYINRMTYY